MVYCPWPIVQYSGGYPILDSQIGNELKEKKEGANMKQVGQGEVPTSKTVAT